MWEGVGIERAGGEGGREGEREGERWRPRLQCLAGGSPLHTVERAARSRRDKGDYGGDGALQQPTSSHRQRAFRSGSTGHAGTHPHDVTGAARGRWDEGDCGGECPPAAHLVT